MKTRPDLNPKEMLFLTICGLAGAADGIAEAVTLGHVDLELQYDLVTSDFALWAGKDDDHG